MAADSFPFVSIVICHWNAGARTIACLEQIRRWTLPRDRFEVIVQDNASSDGSTLDLKRAVEEYAAQRYNISFRVLGAHPGVTASLNSAYSRRRSDSAYMVRLDNDVELSPSALADAIEYLEANPQVGLVGPRILYRSDPERLNSGAIWLNAWGGRNRMDDPSQPTECEALLGAVLICRVIAIEKAGYWFDPSLYLFAEEPDLCWRMKKAGYTAVYFPKATALHDTGISTGKHSHLSDYLNHRNHTLVFNRIFPVWISAVRNLSLLARVIVRSIRAWSSVPLSGFLDGLVARKLNDRWWQSQIEGNEFRRP